MSCQKYFHCVKREDYLGAGGSIALGIFKGLGVGLIFNALFAALDLPSVANGFLAAAILYGFADGVCAYLLGGKLVCIGLDQCVIGRIIHIEQPGYGKSTFEQIDDDYCINILVSPVQAQFMNPQPETDGLPYARYYVTFPDEGQLAQTGEGISSGVDASVPGDKFEVLHCEFKGCRVHDFCQTAKTMASLAVVPGVVCAVPGIGQALCALAILIWLVATIVALLDSWFGAHEGDPADVAVDPTSGVLHVGDCVVLIGDWVYDHAHGGWNEIHPVRSVQKIPADAFPPGVNCDRFADEDDPLLVNLFKTRVLEKFCERLAEARSSLTREEQKKPHLRWIYHPYVDGCEVPK
ncbi:MAG TPA: hypothetical protein VF546_06770 [Pyrinomonadaceae bacterium]